LAAAGLGGGDIAPHCTSVVRTFTVSMSLAIFIPESEVRALAPAVGEGGGSLGVCCLQALGRWAEEEEEGRDNQDCLEHVSLMILQVRLQ